MSAEKEKSSNHDELLLTKSQRFIHSAEVLVEEGDFDSAVSRLYYAMFYIAQVLLQALGLTFSSHRGVISAYGQHFAKTGELDSRFHQALLYAFSQRQLGDYMADSGLQREDVQILLVDAHDFLIAGKRWLDRRG